MSDEVSRQVYRIRLLAGGRGRQRAEDVYAETFGRKINDPNINAEIDGLLGEALANGHDVVAVPIDLLLAIVLRPGGRGRGRPSSILEERWNELAIRVARRLKTELIAGGKSPGKAAECAAKKAKEQVRGRISAETILDRIDRPKRGGKGRTASR